METSGHTNGSSPITSYHEWSPHPHRGSGTLELYPAVGDSRVDKASAMSQTLQRSNHTPQVGPQKSRETTENLKSPKHSMQIETWDTKECWSENIVPKTCRRHIKIKLANASPISPNPQLFHPTCQKVKSPKGITTSKHISNCATPCHSYHSRMELELSSVGRQP